ncbi:Chimeric ERCC6-PGBD3 protein [Araneus ventricosus]|uniref:Chimeric ERCC6-PGBD3 protein n=1 Tax=Araneus ventricosus TaxID=182803 RepID=A0A4Y2T6D2_ARAVE|nr:Chimeric ERCC6-PGBD3 protein [Araneus ventricosus]
MRFLGVIFYSGHHILPREKTYWENAPDTGTTLVSQAMSRKRYFDIKKYLHCNDNTAIDSDRSYKVRRIYTLLNEVQQFGMFSEHLSIDERMVHYFGRHGCKMYMKGKPVKFRYYHWIL